MAGAAFKDPETVKILEHFTPIIVDGDTEQDFSGKFGVTGFPCVVFANAKGEEVLRVSGAVGTAQFRGRAESAKKKAKKGKPAKEYTTLLKAKKDLDKALGKKTSVKSALTAIAKIEKVGRPGSILDAARRAKDEIFTDARKKLDEANAAFDAGELATAKKHLRKLILDFKGTEIGDQAAELNKQVKEAESE